MDADDFYKLIEYLIDASVSGVVTGRNWVSLQAGTIGAILVPGEHGDSRSSEVKGFASIIELLSQKTHLPYDFFEKPFYFPFSDAQLERLKGRCWAAESDSACFSMEKRLIALYEKILKEQNEVIERLSPNIVGRLSDVLHTRVDILKTVLEKINTQLENLEKRSKTPSVFDKSENIEIKIRKLSALRDNLKMIHDDYLKKMNAHVSELGAIDPYNYLQDTENYIRAAFKYAYSNKACKHISEHNNPFVRFLDAIFRAITLGFRHIPTESEHVIAETKALISKNF